ARGATPSRSRRRDSRGPGENASTGTDSRSSLVGRLAGGQEAACQPFDWIPGHGRRAGKKSQPAGDSPGEADRLQPQILGRKTILVGLVPLKQAVLTNAIL